MSLDLVTETCRRVAKDVGTPEFLLEALIENLEDSIRLVPQSITRDTPGVSRIGGLPDLPNAIDWPRYHPRRTANSTLLKYANFPLSFLAQINLSAIPESVHLNPMPRKGWLLFFYLDTVYHKICDDEFDTGVVLHFDGDATVLTRAERPEDLSADQVFQCCDLLPEREITVPSPYEIGMDDRVEKHLELWDTLGEEVESVQGFGPWYSPKHRMLGHPQLIQGSGLAETKLLLQVDSDAGQGSYPETGMTWGDGGTVYFLISNKDLQSGKFQKATPLLEMS